MARKLILQMQISLDGYVSAERDDLDWQVWDWGPDWRWDPDLRQYFNMVFEGVDTILLSRPMIEGGYLDHWQQIAQEHGDAPEFRFARRIVEIDKVVVTSQAMDSRWERVRVRPETLGDVVSELKAGDGGAIISFGGVRFATSLVELGLVDELHLFVNPTAVGAGRSIFDSARRDGLRLSLVASQAYSCGIVVNCYERRVVATESATGIPPAAP
jgi:dihydrofolate reductase